MKRRSGILFHITSLPSEFGIGDLGPGAYWFADLLALAKQKIWQILPLNPTDGAYQHSPYSSFSAFAGNTYMISPEFLLQDDLLTKDDFNDKPEFPADRVDFERVIAYKKKLFEKAYDRFKHARPLAREFKIFEKNNESWLKDYALFVTIKESLGAVPWTEWPDELKDRDRQALLDFEAAFKEQVEYAKFLQFIFFRQWEALRAYSQERGIQFLGDMPIYVIWDSADAWAHKEIFKIDEHDNPVGVAGVPPDYFSQTGQLWGNPVYDWEKLKASGYGWWIARVRHNLDLFDYVRIDHFRGFVQYWEIPNDAPSAVSGKWVDVPTRDFFDTLKKTFNPLPIIAEDLGLITDDVREIMKEYNLPGMKVLLFAFGEDLEKHPYLPHNYEPNFVAYTGTHDNNTVQGWFQHEAGPKEKENLFAYIGRQVPQEEIHWELIRMAFMSQADTVIVPMQDVLGLGQEARFNKPATHQGNWQWRISHELINDPLLEELRDITRKSSRNELSG